MDLILNIIILAVLAAAPGLILGPQVSAVWTAAVAVAFVVGMTLASVWAVGCWSCRLNPDATMVRHDTLVIAPGLVAMFVVPMIVGLWIGVLARHIVFRKVMSL